MTDRQPHNAAYFDEYVLVKEGKFRSFTDTEIPSIILISNNQRSPNLSFHIFLYNEMVEVDPRKGHVGV